MKFSDSGPFLVDTSKGDGGRNPRRRFLGQSALAITGILLPWSPIVNAAERPIHDLRGNVKINGTPATADSVINPGDTVVTGTDGYIVFVIGESAFMLRSRSELVVDKPAPEAYGAAYGLIRLLTGALGATFKKGTPAGLRIANATIGIRGTGIYMETRGTGTYFCTCWGKTEITIADTQLQKEFVEATRHNPRFIAQKALENGSFFMPAPFETHTDGEMDILEKCVKRRAPWITEAR